MWLFKQTIRKKNNFSNEALEILLDEGYKDKFKVYAKYIAPIDGAEFINFVCKNGNKEQILAVVKYAYITYSLCQILIERFDDDFLAHLLLEGKNNLSGYGATFLIKKGLEKSLITYLNTLKASNKLSAFGIGSIDFEKELLNSNFKEAIEFYLSNCDGLSNFARMYIIQSKDKKKIEILEKREHLLPDEYIALLETDDADLQKFAITKAIEAGFSPNTFVAKVLFIKNDDIIKQYIKYVVLNNEMEYLLVKNASNDIIRYYVEENEKLSIFTNTSLEYIFENRDSELRDFIFDKYGLPYVLEKQLIQSGDEVKIREYVEKFELYILNECLLVKTASIENILCYINTTELSSAAEVCLMKSNNRTLCKQYLEISDKENHILSDTALNVFISNGDVDDVISYIKAHNLNLKKLAKYCVIRGDNDLIKFVKPYIKEELVRDISKTATPEQLIKLFDNPLVMFDKEAQCELCVRKDIMFLGDLDNNSLSGTKDNVYGPAIMYFIKERPLCVEAEALLFSEIFYNEDVVKYYISLYQLNKKNIKFLYVPKYKNIFLEYLKRHPITESQELSNFIAEYSLEDLLCV